MSKALENKTGSPDQVLYDIVVVSYNQRDRLLACLESAVATNSKVRLIVIDNASVDDSAQAVATAYPDATLVTLPENVGFAAAVNQGVSIGAAPYILLLNNDARLGSQALDRMRQGLGDQRVAAVGPHLVGPNGQTELSLDRTLSLWSEAYFKMLGAFYGSGRGPMAAYVRKLYANSRDVLSLSGACILLRREAFEQVDGFDERFFLYAEDIDLCLRLRQTGWSLRYEADAVVEHDRGASRSTTPMATTVHYRQSQLAFYRKHRGALATESLRLYLAFRFVIKRLFVRGKEQRKLADDLLHCTLHEPDR